MVQHWRRLADLEVVSRWCVGFAISFAVVLGFADLSHVLAVVLGFADLWTDSSLSRWRFVGLWWPVVGFC